MKNIQWRKLVPHVVAFCVFLAFTYIYFSPVLDGKVIQQGDIQHFSGMSEESLKYYQEEGESSAWLGSMFSGMPAYQVAVYGLPENHLGVLEFHSLFSYSSIRPLFLGALSFYILMCVMGCSFWLSLLGSIAFAFASYNIIIIEAGHNTKAYAIAYMPLVLAGMTLLFRRKLLWGVVLFTVGVALSVFENHLQITYYLALFCVFVYLGFVYREIIQKKYKDLLKITGLMVVGVLLAVSPNLGNLYGNYEMSQTSLRGKSELTKIETGEKKETASSGLDKEYAFQWSYGWKELMTVLVPNVYGGSSGGTLDSSSELYKELRKNGAQVGKEVQTYTYWGDKIFTSGPVYFGAIVCFLFVLGMFVIRNSMKWWMFAGALFFTFLALGRNFSLFNDFMFHYLPMYNKFRTPEMALVIPGFVFPIIAVWGLKEVFFGETDEKLFKKGFFWALGITGGLSLLLWLMPSLLLNFQSTYDAQFQNQVPEWYYASLLIDRASLCSADALRSLAFIVLGALLVLWGWRSRGKKNSILLATVGLAVLTLIDLWSVDKRYLNDSNFSKVRPQETYKATAADNEILKDTDPSYRVLNINNPWQETNTAFFHKSIGGYHAAKLRRYQELIDHRLNKELSGIVKALQSAKEVEDIVPAFAASPSLNMLNMRYLIYNPGQAPIRNPYAFGNAWFVDKVEIVENADAEIEALNTINPLVTAVVDKRFAKDVEGFVPERDSTATIVLESYRPNRMVYKSKTDKEQLAVFSEIYYQPGWKATIDGKEVPHFRADWTLRAMRVPAGEHTIVYEFKPEGYITATYISSYSSLLILLLLVVAIGWSGWKYWKTTK